MNLDNTSLKVQKFYDTMPYESYGVDFSVLFKSLRKDFGEIESVFKNKKVLEVGCGAGHISLYISKFAESVLGIDLSKKSIDFATEQSAKLGIKNATFIQANLFDEEFIEKNREKFDYILCYGVLHHTADPYKGFQQLLKMLNKDGIVTIGLYSRTMIKYRLQRKLILFLSGDDWKKREKWSRKLFKNKRDVTLFDSFVNPQVSFHSIGEIYFWLQKNNLEYLGSWPPIEISYYLEEIKSKLKINKTQNKFKSYNYNLFWFFVVEIIWTVLGKSIMVNLSAKKKF